VATISSTAEFITVVRMISTNCLASNSHLRHLANANLNRRRGVARTFMTPRGKPSGSRFCSALPFLFTGSDASFLFWLIMGMSRKAL
jgi:hypothetical protein